MTDTIGITITELSRIMNEIDKADKMGGGAI